MILPSKELLSAIFKVKVINVEKIKGNKIYYQTYKAHNCTMNIYQLMHFMKEFATDSYQIVSSYTDLSGYGVASLGKDELGREIKPIRDNTEFEAVTKACEWILNERV